MNLLFSCDGGEIWKYDSKSTNSNFWCPNKFKNNRRALRDALKRYFGEYFDNGYAIDIEDFKAFIWHHRAQFPVLFDTEQWGHFDEYSLIQFWFFEKTEVKKDKFS